MKKLLLPLLATTLLIGGCSFPGLGGSSKNTIRIATLSTIGILDNGTYDSSDD